jgi:hypothetical protein
LIARAIIVLQIFPLCYFLILSPSHLLPPLSTLFLYEQFFMRIAFPSRGGEKEEERKGEEGSEYLKIF